LVSGSFFGASESLPAMGSSRQGWLALEAPRAIRAA
jgi:hypothetical protein